MSDSARPADDLRPVPAVGVVCFRGEEVLLIRRGTPPRQGEWALPGGRIEPGEPVQAAALRELRLITQHYVLVDYAARWVSGIPSAGDDAAEARFFHQSELSSLNLWDETLRVIDAAAARLRRD